MVEMDIDLFCPHQPPQQTLRSDEQVEIIIFATAAAATTVKRARRGPAIRSTLMDLIQLTLARM